MPFIPEDQIDQVRNQTDIVQLIGDYLPLKRAGRNYKGLCPFHGEKTPSFMVSAEKQIYHCFGCGEGGNAFSFLMKFQGLDFVEAAKKLADRAGVTLTLEERGGEPQGERKEKENLQLVNRLAARFYYETLRDGEKGERGQAFLARRKIEDETAKRFGLGYAPASGHALWDYLRGKGVSLEQAEKVGLVRHSEGRVYDFFRDRLIFPIRTDETVVIAFGGRALTKEQEEGAKFINSPDSPLYNKRKTLYGYFEGRPAIRQKDFVIIVEGYLDLLMMVQNGFENVVAPLGTALTDEQLRLLGRQTRKICVLFDADSAGEKAAERALDIGLELGYQMETIVLPEGDDPDSFLLREGSKILQEKLDRRGSLFEVLLQRTLKQAHTNTLGKTEAVRTLLPFLSKTQSEVERTLYIQKVAQKVGVSEAVIQAEINSNARNYSGNTYSKSLATNPNPMSISSRGRSQNVDKIPVTERTLFELLLGTAAPPLKLTREIHPQDFSREDLAAFWDWLTEKIHSVGVVDVASLAGAAPNEDYRFWISRFSIESGYYMEGDLGVIVEDCLKRVRETRLKKRLKRLTQEIQAAEETSDEKRLAQLLQEKNDLVKGRVHGEKRN